MSAEHRTPKTDGSSNPRGYRRKWKCAPAERRSVAASTLSDVFAGRRVRGLLWATLILSLAGHAVTVPVVSRRGPAGIDIAAAEDSYLQKVMQKDRAKRVSRDIRNKITMPPPPPDPEAVVESALGGSLVADVEKITSGMLSVDLQKDLANYVKTSLADELAAASRRIAEGKLSEEEIAALHRKFQEKAHEKTKDWRQEYLIEHQEERAALSTTQWYEQEVSPTLFGNMWYDLFGPGNKWPPSKQVWHRAYTGVYGWGRYPNWSNIRSEDMLRGKLGSVRDMIDGKWHNAGGDGKHEHPAWPGPDADQAEIINATLQDVFNGRYTQTYPRPAWKDVVYGSQDTPRMTQGVLEEFHPHRLDEARVVAQKLDALWAKALDAAGRYADQAGGGASAADLKAVHAELMDALKQIAAEGGKLLVKGPEQYVAVNWALRLDMVTGDERDKQYDAWVDGLVDGLAPLIKDFARGQFKKGIIVHTGGVEAAMKEFPTTIIPLIRRDVEKICTRRQFQDRVHDTVYAPEGYASDVTGKRRLPNRKDAEKELAEAEKMLSAESGPPPAYADARRKLLLRDFATAVRSTRELILEMVFTGDLLFKKMGDFVEGVDYADRVQEKLDARAMALKGRGQDLARLTADGVPDTSAPLVALMFGASKGHGASLEPVQTSMAPRHMNRSSAPAAAVRLDQAAWPKAPAKWGFVEQAKLNPDYDTTRFEAVPFLAKFPRLDGDLSDWGTVRPLILHPAPGEDAILVYAAWNYQGFFFGYSVRSHPDEFYWPSLYRVAYSLHSYVLGAGMAEQKGTGWAYAGDHLRLCFDTLDARSDTRGEPHTQEFVVFPLGTENSPDLPGIERVIESKRDAATKEYRGVKDECKLFTQQAPAPDGTGPYRITRQSEQGYTTEVFLPRSLFNTPVFCPGWNVGFDGSVAVGHQGRAFKGQRWGSGSSNFADRPNSWGDLLLLGTDPRLVVQEARAGWPTAGSMTPGHSYLVTIVDPDRNVHPTAVDTVLVSAEVEAESGDVEVFILNESEENSGLFRGFINTQPGAGRQVQGVLEIMPLQSVRLGYVDVADARGRRNVMHRVGLPVVAGVVACQNVSSTAGP